MAESSEKLCLLGVDTGPDLHVVISRKRKDGRPGRQCVFLGVMKSYAELGDLIGRFNVSVCVIDALPEIHVTREIAERNHGRVRMNHFNVHQKSAPKWDYRQQIVQENRTEILDLSRRVVREGERLLPRQTEIVREFARHLAADAKVLHEDEETGAQEYQYVKTAANHFGMAFTYECLAAMRADYAELPLIDFGGPPRGGDGLWIPFGDWVAGMGLFR